MRFICRLTGCLTGVREWTSVRNKSAYFPYLSAETKKGDYFDQSSKVIPFMRLKWSVLLVTIIKL